jgi:hypothetical protein
MDTVEDKVSVVGRGALIRRNDSWTDRVGLFIGSVGALLILAILGSNGEGALLFRRKREERRVGDVSPLVPR